jgi:hypothetical protein
MKKIEEDKKKTQLQGKCGKEHYFILLTLKSSEFGTSEYSIKNIYLWARCLCLTPVIMLTWETKSRRIMLQTSDGIK